MATRSSMPSYVSYIFSIRFDLKNLLPLTTCSIFICWTEIKKIYINLKLFLSFYAWTLNKQSYQNVNIFWLFVRYWMPVWIIFPGKGSVRGRSSLTPRMKQTVGQLLTYEHELRDLSNQVSNKIEFLWKEQFQHFDILANSCF